MLRNIVRKMHVKPIKMRWASGGVNYSYLLSTQDKTLSWLIDPAEYLEVVDALDTEELMSITSLANTHHHYDHSEGNLNMLLELKKANTRNIPRVIAGSKTSPGATDIPTDLQKFQLGNLEIICIRTPCHTQDSICYYVKDTESNERCIFTGDTLFTGGCGRFFEGNGKDMDAALNDRLLNCVGEANWGTTKVYPGHEYTKSNVNFIRKAIYKNPDDNKALDELEKYTNTHEVTTGQYTLSDELKYNPFMRLDDPLVRKAVGDNEGELSRADVMDKLRKMKNSM